MGIISMIRGLYNMIFNGKVKEEFEIESIISSEMESILRDCANIYSGNPKWADESEHIKTINFAKSICSETARLATLAIGIQVEGSARADWLQNIINRYYYDIREWVEYACGFGTVILKPSTDGIDMYTTDRVVVTGQKDGNITGIVFITQEEEIGIKKKYYTRLEYHRWIKDTYVITNKCYIGKSKNDVKTEISIEKTPWKGMNEEVGISNLEKPLYAVLKTPHANNVDIHSPYSLPVFAEAIEELKDLDIAYSRNSKEIYDSKRILLLDSDKMLPDGSPIKETLKGFEYTRKQMGLPDMVKNVWGDGQESFYQEINPNLNTDVRLTGINALLSQIGYKCGFSNGYFVFNESTGIQTATGVEAEQQRTIQFIKDVRDKLEACLTDLIYALNAFADLYNLSPFGTYEIVFDFGDITYNREEDRARWYGYASAGRIPFWYYLVKFEGMTKEDAKALEKEAQPKEPTLFGPEE